MSARSVSAGTTRSSRRETAPLGIKLLCLVSGPFSVIGAVGSLVVLAHGGRFFGLGAFALIFSIGQIVVLVGLWSLEPWAWTWAIALYGLNGLVSLFVHNDMLGMFVSFGVLVYVASKKEYYR